MNAVKENQAEVKDLRFTPGQTYIFINVDFTRGAPAAWSSLYRPWLEDVPGGDKLNGIYVVTAECQSHHRVPGNYDDIVQYDGFLFSHTGGNVMPPEGLVWANQYPRATYGQLDDAADRVVQLHSITSAKEDIDAAVKWHKETFTGRSWGSFTHAETFIGNIANGRAEIEEAKAKHIAEPFNDKYKPPRDSTWDQVISSMTEYMNKVMDAIRENLDYEVEFIIEKHRFQADGQWHTLDKYFDVTIKRKE